MLILWIVVGLGVAAGISAVIPTQWESESRILVGGPTIMSRGGNSDFITQLTNVPSDNYDVTTQIQILQSQEVLFALFNAAGVPLPRTIEEYEKGPKISVQQLLDTNVISARVTAPTDKVARDLASKLPGVYEDYVKKETTTIVDQTKTFIDSRLTEENALLEKARTDLAEFQRQNNLASSQAQQQVTADEIRQSSVDVRTAEAVLEGADSAYKKTSEDYNALPKTVDLPIVRSNVALIDQENHNLQVLEQNLQALQSQYQPNHPLVKAAKAQVDSQKQYIAGIPLEVKEISKVRNPLLDQMELRLSQVRADLYAARSRMQILKAKDAELQGRAGGDADKLKGLADREKAITNHELSIQNLKAQQDAIKLKQNSIRKVATPLSPATLAEQTQPNWPINLVAGAAIGLFLGLISSVVRDANQDKVLSTTIASRLADSYVLARVPRRASNARAIMMNPGEALSFEAYRLLRTNVLAGELGKQLKTVAVTSSVVGEGASTVAGNLAVALAQEGKKTLLLEANMRDPIQDRLFDLTANGGLNQAITQGTDASSLAIDTAVPNLKVLVAGGKSPNATEALASTAFDAVLAKLKAEFDYIVIDAPAAYTTADAHEVARKSDGVLYVVEGGKPSKTQLVESTNMLRHAGGKLLGLVMNKDKGALNRIS